MKKLFSNMFFTILIITLIVILLAFVGFIIYVHVKFANVPIGEVPSWAGWIMFR